MRGRVLGGGGSRGFVGRRGRSDLTSVSMMSPAVAQGGRAAGSRPLFSLVLSCKYVQHLRARGGDRGVRDRWPSRAVAVARTATPTHQAATTSHSPRRPRGGQSPRGVSSRRNGDRRARTGDDKRVPATLASTGRGRARRGRQAPPPRAVRPWRWLSVITLQERPRRGGVRQTLRTRLVRRGMGKRAAPRRRGCTTTRPLPTPSPRTTR